MTPDRRRRDRRSVINASISSSSQRGGIQQRARRGATIRGALTNRGGLQIPALIRDDSSSDSDDNSDRPFLPPRPQFRRFRDFTGNTERHPDSPPGSPTELDRNSTPLSISEQTLVTQSIHQDREASLESVGRAEEQAAEGINNAIVPVLVNYRESLYRTEAIILRLLISLLVRRGPDEVVQRLQEPIPPYLELTNSTAENLPITVVFANKEESRVTEEEDNDITILDTTEIQLSRSTLYLPVRGNIIQVKIGAEEDTVADEPVTETEPVNIVELYSDNQETSETSSSELD